VTDESGVIARWPVIAKDPAAFRVPPNLADYEAARATFTWDRARAALDGLPDGGLNIAHEAVDRHASGPRRDAEALRFVRTDGSTRSYTYAELAEHSNRFAAVLRDIGVGRGDRVFSLLGRCPELFFGMLGALKLGAVFCPLFSAFGPEPIRQRLRLGCGRALITTQAHFRRKVAPVRDDLPDLERVLLVDADRSEPGTLDLAALLRQARPISAVTPTRPEDPALLHFTSGTTGAPKGALHVHEAVVAHYATGLYALDLHPDDIYWCTADPGWVTGTSYGVIAPLVHGVTTVVDEAEMDVQRWYRILAEQRVSVWYTAPTALRMLKRAGVERARDHDLSSLRFVASVGEPLNPEVVTWGQEAWGLPVHDNWWQTETGGIMIANFVASDIRPGSMGRPLPGVEAAIVARDDNGDPLINSDGTAVLVHDPEVEGELALRPGWPSMFRAYLNDEERYRRCFAGGWYLTGDLVRRDPDGWYWFVGRGDDVIKSAGHLIGPFEVENSLMEHPAVAEAGVIGVPDPVAGQLVKAFVQLRPGYEPSDALRSDILAMARKLLGPTVAPREIAFADDLPKTKSGKILRRLLRARELGLPEGDLSTVEAAR
jgi:acetyl-CoA synthetase